MGWLTKQSTLSGGLLHLLPVMLVAMAICVVLGLIIERLAYRPLRRAPRLTALITAIGVSLLLEGAAQLRSCSASSPSSTPEILPSGPEATMHFGNLTVSKNALVIVITSFVLMSILWYIVQRTKMGKAMRAVSHDFDAAALMGINTDVVISFTFGLGAALAAAGACCSAR